MTKLSPQNAGKVLNSEIAAVSDVDAAVGTSSIGASRVAKQLAENKPRHFSVDHLREDLKGRSIRGGAVTLGAHSIKFALSLMSMVVLARLLTPADFGLVAMVTSLTGFVAMFKDAGLSMATVQREEINHAQVSTLFWINVALSLILMCLVGALAPVVAWFYDEPELVRVTLAIAATFIIGGLTPQHMALLKRQMRFTAMAGKDIAAMTAGVAVGITLARLGAGYWALIAMAATSALVDASLAWVLTGWIPGLPRRGTGVRPMLAFGGNLTAAKFINYFSRSADNVLVGWFWGAGALGVYAKAYALMTLPISKVLEPLGSIAVPALSRLQHQPSRYRNYYFTALSALAWITMPLMAVMAVSAEPLILIMLGPQWEATIPIFRILAVAGILQPIYSTVRWIFQSNGNGRGLLRLLGALAPLFIVSFLVGLPFGPSGVALAYTIVFLAALPFVFHYTFRGTPLTMIGLLRTLIYPAFFAVSVVTGVLAAVTIGQPATLVHHVRLLTVGAIIGAAASVLIPGLRCEVLHLTNTLHAALRPSKDTL